MFDRLLPDLTGVVSDGQHLQLLQR